jgi:hypothetical protein
MRKYQRKRESLKELSFMEEVHGCAGRRYIPRGVGVIQRKLKVSEELSDSLKKKGVELEVQMLTFDIPV